MAALKGGGKSKSTGPRVEFRTISGGIPLQDLVGIRGALSVNLGATTLPGIRVVRIEIGDSGTPYLGCKWRKYPMALKPCE